MDYQSVIELVKQAGAFVFDEDLAHQVTMKGAADYLTAVDLKISGFLKEQLFRIAPEIGFMSEEGAEEHSRERWILDPVDGTTNLVYGYRMSSVSLAHFRDGKVIFGVVYNPYSGELFVAERGKGAFLNGKRMSPAQDRDPVDCLVEFGAGSTKKQYADKSFALAKSVFLDCLDLRRICSSALAICFVAAGRLNAYFERVIKPWDYAAASLICEECGVKVTNWTGGPVSYDVESSYICGTEKVHALILKKIAETDALH